MPCIAQDRTHTAHPAARQVLVALEKVTQMPAAFHRRGRTYRISAIQDCWRLSRAWWDGEPERTFFRVVIETGGIFELSYDHGNHTWQISRIED